MNKSRYTDLQILGIVKHAAKGILVAQLCRGHGMSSATFFTSGEPNTAGWMPL